MRHYENVQPQSIKHNKRTSNKTDTAKLSGAIEASYRVAAGYCNVAAFNPMLTAEFVPNKSRHKSQHKSRIQSRINSAMAPAGEPL